MFLLKRDYIFSHNPYIPPKKIKKNNSSMNLNINDGIRVIKAPFSYFKIENKAITTGIVAATFVLSVVAFSNNLPEFPNMIRAITHLIIPSRTYSQLHIFLRQFMRS